MVATTGVLRAAVRPALAATADATADASLPVARLPAAVVEKAFGDLRKLLRELPQNGSERLKALKDSESGPLSKLAEVQTLAEPVLKPIMDDPAAGENHGVHFSGTRVCCYSYKNSSAGELCRRLCKSIAKPPRLQNRVGGFGRDLLI